MKIPFDIKYKQDILDGKVKVVTRDNASVEIIRWDAKNEKYPLIGIVNCEDNEQPNSWTLEGATVFGGWGNGQDLFLLTQDHELTEFEKCFIKEIAEVHGAVVPVDMEEVKKSCGKLLEIAKKGLMEDLPKWKETPTCTTPAVYCGFLYYHDRCIGIEELFDKLPKEV